MERGVSTVPIEEVIMHVVILVQTVAEITPANIFSHLGMSKILLLKLKQTEASFGTHSVFSAGFRL